MIVIRYHGYDEAHNRGGGRRVEGVVGREGGVEVFPINIQQPKSTQLVKKKRNKQTREKKTNQTQPQKL